MQDFTKQPKVNNISTTEAKNDKWLNKDRLWNFVFWFGMSTGLAIAHFLRTNLLITNLATFIYISTFVGIPLLLVIFNKTTFIKKDTFANSEDKILTKKQMPYMFPLAIISGIAFSVLTSVFLPKNTNSLFVAFALSISVFSGLSLYFILKNCPISILFNYRFWNFELRQGIQDKHFNNGYGSLSINNRYNDLSHSHLPGNIHYRR